MRIYIEKLVCVYGLNRFLISHKNDILFVYILVKSKEVFYIQEIYCHYLLIII